jgi:hypothetical protein
VFEGDDRGIRRLGKDGNILNALKCLRTELKKKKTEKTSLKGLVDPRGEPATVFVVFMKNNKIVSI